jgi:hypothetical protein
MTGDKKETDAEKALRYLEHARGLVKVAATIKDEESQQLVVEAAQHYERLAAALTATPSSMLRPRNP